MALINNCVIISCHSMVLVDIKLNVLWSLLMFSFIEWSSLFQTKQNKNNNKKCIERCSNRSHISQMT